MTTREQQRFYVDITMIRSALERIASALELITLAVDAEARGLGEEAKNAHWKATGEGTVAPIEED